MISPRRLLLALIAGALGLLLLLAYLIWSGHREAIRSTEATTRSYAAAFEARLDATLRHANAVLQTMAHQIPRAALDQQAVPLYARALDATLDLEIANFAELAGIRITDASGNILYTSDSANTPRAQVADRSYFRAVRDNPQVNLAFSEVITARTTGRQSVAVAKALRDEQGAFRGTVYVLLDLEHFLKLMKSLDLGANGAVVIRRSDDFTRVLRWPEDKAPPNTALPQNSPTRALLAGGARTATTELTASVDGIKRIYSFHALHSYPFHIAVGIARDDALAGWRTRSLVAGLSTLVLLGLLISLLLRLERAHAAHAQLASIVGASNDAILSRDTKGTIVSWNPGATALFGYSAEEIIGRHVSLLVPLHLRHEIKIGQEQTASYSRHSHDSVRLTKDGRMIDVSVSAAPIRDTTGHVNGVALIFRDISERKQAEALRTQLAAIVEQTNVAIFTRTLDGTILSWNAGAERMFGYVAEEAVGKSVSITLPPGQPRNLEKNNAAMIRGDLVVRETARMAKDGRVISVLASQSPIRDDAGNIVGASVVQQDITELKQAQAAVKESEERLRAIIENEPECVKIVSVDGRLLEMNQAGLAMIEADSLEQVRDGQISDLVTEGHRAAFARLHQRVMRGERGKLEFGVVGLKGGRRVLETHATPLRDASGHITALLGVTRDITERKQSERAQAQLAAIVETSSDAIVSRAPDDTILSWNSAAERLFGWTKEEVLGQSFRALTSITPEDKRRRRFEKALRGESSTIPSDDIRRRKDGSTVHVQMTMSGVPDEHGKILFVSCIIRDSTELKRAEAERASLEAQLRESQKMEAIGTLAGGIAHDFNNIIATILGNAELARQDAKANPAALESLAEIDKAGKRARDLVQQILSFSRRQPTERKPIALAPVIEEAARLLRATLPARIALETFCDHETPLVRADANLIEQVILNLATNAMQAMHGRSGRIDIRLDTVTLDAAFLTTHPALQKLQAQCPGRIARLVVSDNGPGMDAATAARAFEPFFSTKPAGEGTGLGLSVVHGIVQIHDGAIEMKSQPNQGSTFTIYLPLAGKVTPQSDERILTPRRALILAEGQHILYLDDDEALVFLVRRLLERRGFRVSAYTDQKEALAALRAAPETFDLVLTDYNMPGMSGLDVARAAREIRADLPVAVTSGFIDETLQAQAVDAGVSELLFKASSVEAFCDSVQQLTQTVLGKSLSR